ncbi:MAG: alpha-glucan family phosphorylase [Myxococcales bacterium]|nr:alpha-glucan family phosphorylase [Myxococcales bacterium]
MGDMLRHDIRTPEALRGHPEARTVVTDAELLTCIRSLAGNYRWSWHTPTRQLFVKADPAGMHAARNSPWAWLRRVGEGGAVDAFRKAELESAVVVESLALRTELDRPFAETAPKVAYFCFEFGIHETLPIYAGGLGILAGDHLKACSDAGVDCVAFGLFYPEGYLAQGLDAQGRQVADIAAIDRADQPMRKLPEGVVVGMPGGAVHADVYELRVGRTRLYLLDTDNERNTDPALRALCRRLYGGDPTVRIRQEILLGIGGIRLLQRLGLGDRVLHLNEGHCAFALAEAVRLEEVRSKDRAAAVASVRARSVFTTHTPVPAGHDRFDAVLASEHLTAAFGGESEFVDFVQRHGFESGTSPGSVCMTVLALELTGRCNGVSAIHGRVSREMWHRPIGHVTNGVHVPTWVAPQVVALTSNSSLAEVGAVRLQLRRRLVRHVRERLLAMPAQNRTGNPDLLGDECLTIGFARRFAPYKRATLLLGAVERLAKLLTDSARPMQILYAGKAHPADKNGQELIRLVIEAVRDPRFGGRVHFVPDYDMEMGRLLVQGCDIWLNTPRRPLEASGTSGQKAGMNGCLNVSVPDGWWPESYDGHNGWVIGADVGEVDAATQDAKDLHSMLDVLEKEVIPTFYGGEQPGRGDGWLSRVRRSMETVTLAFSAERMIGDYTRDYYLPAYKTIAAPQK